MFLRIVFLLALFQSIGCSTSKWAMDDPDYAEKYSKPYNDGEKIPRMTKQLVDARHVEGKTGMFVGLAGQTKPASVGGEIGVFGYPRSWASLRASFAGLGSTETSGAWVTGVDLGARFQPPSRLAPFVGIGTMLAVEDNDEEDRDSEGFAAIYPELGVHFWTNGKSRISASGRYMVSDSRDFWYYGIQAAWLIGDGLHWE